MPQSEKCEIMNKYASLVSEAAPTNALTYGNIAQALGIEAAGIAGGGALGTILGGASATGIGAAIIGGVLSGGFATYAIFEAMKATDNTVKELIDRLEDLDYADTNAEQALEGWINTLKGYLPKLQFVPDTGDRAKDADKNLTKWNVLREILSQLQIIQNSWPKVKPMMQDWQFTGRWGDIGQAEMTIHQTTAAVTKQLLNLTQKIQAASKKFIAEQSKKTGVQYVQLATDIDELYARLTHLGGKAPKFDTTDEKAAWRLAQRILNKTGKIEPPTEMELNTGGPLMVKLKELMKQGVRYFEEKTAQQEQEYLAQQEQATKTQSANPALSKRALTLGDGKQIGVVSKPSKKHKRRRRDNATSKLQKVVNILNAKYNPQMSLGKIREDGIYGPNTAAATKSLLLKFDKLKNAAEKVGITIKHVDDFASMRRNQNAVAALYNVMAPYAGAAAITTTTTVPAAGAEETTRQPERGISRRDIGVKCNPSKHDPTSDEIVSCLKNYFKVKDRQTDEWYYAYYWLNSLGVYSEDRMVRLVQDAFPPARYRPMDWDPTQFVSYVTNRLGGRHGIGKLI